MCVPSLPMQKPSLIFKRLWLWGTPNPRNFTKPSAELTEAALERCVSRGDRHREAALRSNLADLLHAEGRTEAAMLHLKQAASINASIDTESGPYLPEIWKLTGW